MGADDSLRGGGKDGDDRAAPERGSRLVLLTGTTGYVGGRLLTALERRGETLRCLARRPAYLRARVADGTEVVGGDVRDPAAVAAALEGVDTAYYLVHTVGGGARFEDEDRHAARTFAQAARACGVRRIIYLGGLGRGEALSPHLRSRQEVGRILVESGVSVLELRAAIILGSGSASFEIVRALVDRLPVMVAPRWTRVRTQPIAIEDVIAYLVAALDTEIPESRVVELGGADVVSYGELMLEYARQRGLRRFVIPVPVLTPRLSSLWLGIITPVYKHIGAELIEGLRNETVVRDPSARALFAVRPRGVAAAIERALRLEDEEIAQTRWCDALAGDEGEGRYGGVRFGRRLVDSRALRVALPPEAAFRPIQRIGGASGWYHADALWKLRGAIDLLVGGVGLRRGRAHPEKLRPGETLDFWRVERVEPGRLLRLSAEMRLPGRASLQFEVEPVEEVEDGGARAKRQAVASTIRQTAVFDPVGLAGLIYWYALFPVHAYVFSGMLRGIAAAALRSAGAETAGPAPRARGAAA